MTARATIGADIMARLDHLAAVSEEPYYLTRRCYTPQHAEVNAIAMQWMREAGMTARQDAVGNVIGRYEGRTPGAQAILLGSHLDSVIRAGRYDGALGVVTAIECVRLLNERGIRFDYAIEVAAFADEEGVRYQTAYLGSSGLAGSFPKEMLKREDKDGIPLEQAMRDFGLDPARIGEAARRPEEFRCYLELHIEQGPVLEAEDLAVSSVTAIDGSTRMTVKVEGEAGHAGTVPMPIRKDALATAAECILFVERIASQHPHTVGTVGIVEASPGATNVIPDRASFSVDFRAEKDEDREQGLQELKAGFASVASRRGIKIEWTTTLDFDSVTCAPWIREQIEEAMAETDHPRRRLPSGAGHDAAAIARITDVGMIFVRCKGGISHSPLESIREDDAAAGVDVMLRTIERIGGMSN